MKTNTLLQNLSTATGAIGILGEPVPSLAVKELKGELEAATMRDTEAGRVKENIRIPCLATLRTVQRTVIGIIGIYGAPAAKLAAEEKSSEDGLVLKRNMEANGVRELIKKRLTATLKTVQLMVSGETGLPGVTAPNLVDQEGSTEVESVLRQKMVARHAPDARRKTGNVIPIPARPSSRGGTNIIKNIAKGGGRFSICARFSICRKD